MIHTVEWCLYSNAHERAAFPLEICSKSNSRVTKRVLDGAVIKIA